MVNFDNFGGLTSVFKFHIFLNLNCEELVRIRVICKGSVRFFSDVKYWCSIFTIRRIGIRFSQFKSVNNRVMLRCYVCCVLKVLIFVCTLSFCWLHDISNKLLFAQRLEIMNVNDFINSKAKYLRRSHTI